MKGTLRYHRLSHLQPTDDLRQVVYRDAFFHLALLELRCRTANKDHVLSFHLLQRARGQGDRLFAEFGRKLYVDEHIRFEPQVMIGYFAADASRSGLRVEHVADISHLAFKGLVGVGVNRDESALSNADSSQVFLIHFRLNPDAREVRNREDLSACIDDVPRGRLRFRYHPRERRFQRSQKCAAETVIGDSKTAKPLAYPIDESLLRVNASFDSFFFRFA